MSNAYEVVTNRLIAKLESGVIPWRQPWKNTSRHTRSNTMAYKAKLDTAKIIDLQATSLSAAKSEAKKLVRDWTGVTLIDDGLHVAYHAPSANRAPGERFRWKQLA